MKRFLKVALFVFTIMTGLVCADINVMAKPEPKHTPQEVVYVDSKDEIALQLREAMKNRQSSVQIGYKTTKELKKNDIKTFMAEALEHTGVGTEGDYLESHYASYESKVTYIKKQGVYDWTVVYNLKYRSTKEQEDAVDAKVAEILAKLDLEGKSDYHKVKAIYDYMCKNIDYDWNAEKDKSNQLKYTAYAAAVKGKSVCQGYSSLFYRLCLESGVDARIIYGKGDKKDHSWNIVSIDGTYYCVDATWDSSYSEYKWFLDGSKDFNGRHKADSLRGYKISSSSYKYHEHEYKPSVTDATFTKNGTITTKCKTCGLKGETTTIAKVSDVTLSDVKYIYDGSVKRPTVTVKDSNGVELTEGTDYKLTYASGRKYVGRYYVKVSLRGNYSGTKTLYFEIKPVATQITSLTSGAKCFTVKYEKVSKQISGYQIQYSTSENFSSTKSSYVSSYKTVSKKIKSLKANKNYYVRVRVYKKVKISGKYVKMYSEWSDVQEVMTR